MKIMNGSMRSLSVLAGILLFTLALSPQVSASPDASLVAGLKPEEALRLGERMYRQGILSSGEPMQAMVKGDIPADGRAFTCASCHLRSGIGVMEGTVFSSPITGLKLYAPLSKIDRIMFPSRKDYATAAVNEPLRPAYTDGSLARVIRTGEDAAGKQISDVMPKYFLPDRDMEILIYYLKQLSSQPESGVDARRLRLATVIAGEVPREDREAMLGPLRAFVNRWNVVPPMKPRRVREEAFVMPMSKQYRELQLSVWELKGAPETWRTQLEAYQAADPAFALVGGIAASGWEPIHRFCEERGMPAFFPLTDLPVISDQAWYTVYFSKGLYQEGESAARYLHSRNGTRSPAPVVQIIRNDEAGRALARGFRETWEGLGNAAPLDRVLDPGTPATEALQKLIAEQGKNAIVLLWDRSVDLPLLAEIALRRNGPEMVFLSFGLLGERASSLPAEARKLVYFTYPRTLPEDAVASSAAVDRWLKQNNLPSINRDIESRMYSLSLILQNPLTMMMMRDYPYRDYLLERVDMMQSESASSATVPGLSFGNGQRYASKGCYIVQITDGPRPSIVKRAEWIIH